MASRSVPLHSAPPAGGICPITGEAYSGRNSVVLDHLHPSLAERIRQDHPALTADARISRTAADRGCVKTRASSALPKDLYKFRLLYRGFPGLSGLARN